MTQCILNAFKSKMFQCVGGFKNLQKKRNTELHWRATFG